MLKASVAQRYRAEYSKTKRVEWSKHSNNEIGSEGTNRAFILVKWMCYY
jgi:hypothetical protein